MSYTDNQKKFNSSSSPYGEFNKIEESDYREGTSLVERITRFNQNRKPTFFSDFYGLQSSCLLPKEIVYERAKLRFF